jgi:hypothetical protein
MGEVKSCGFDDSALKNRSAPIAGKPGFIAMLAEVRLSSSAER